VRESFLAPTPSGIPSRLLRPGRSPAATRRTHRSGATSAGEAPAATDTAYAELHCLTNFSFLRGASHPEELVQRAAELGYAALAITDRNSLAGVVRAHVAAKEHNLHLIVGAEIVPVDAPPVVLLAPDRPAYGRLARLITRGRLRARKGDCEIRLADIADLGPGLIAIVLPQSEPESQARDVAADRRVGRKRQTGHRRDAGAIHVAVDALPRPVRSPADTFRRFAAPSLPLPLRIRVRIGPSLALWASG